MSIRRKKGGGDVAYGTQIQSQKLSKRSFMWEEGGTFRTEICKLPLSPTCLIHYNIGDQSEGADMRDDSV